MTKSDLIKKMQHFFPHYPPKDIAFAVNIIFAAMTDTLRMNGRIEIRGFGSFSVRSTLKRRFANPKSGKIFNLPNRRKAFFKVGKELQHKINSSP